MSSIASRLQAVHTRIALAAERAQRPRQDITLVAVSKTMPASDLREAYAAGQRIFGENYAQEVREKAEQLRDLVDLQFHFIGRLQRNKVRDVAPTGALIETIDSLRLADELAKHGTFGGKPRPVFIQVNVAKEPQKSGCLPEELRSLVLHVRAIKSLSLRGLMTIPPHDDSAEASRPHFRALRLLALEHVGTEACLSMGMSADLEVAIEEGATHVRVGTAIFGART
jgi:pyridoxal phosphate enzyme (YggS family)